MLSGDTECQGWHTRGVVAVCAWPEDLWFEGISNRWHREHADLLERLGVVVCKVGGRWVAEWTEDQARAYQLLHVFLHELGHHHDRMTTWAARRTARGEPFAERFALELEELIWDDYLRVFPL